MKIITKTPASNGAYPSIQDWPQLVPPEDYYKWPDALETETFYQYNGFVILTVTRGIVQSYEPNVEAWEAWKESLDPEPEPGPTSEERITELEEKNKVLSAQVTALSDQNDFQEELIVELANIVYA